MNEQTDDQPRSQWDFIHFGAIFFGFILGAAGLITGSICGGLTGVFLMGWGLIYFLFNAPED